MNWHAPKRFRFGKQIPESLFIAGFVSLVLAICLPVFSKTLRTIGEMPNHPSFPIMVIQATAFVALILGGVIGGFWALIWTVNFVFEPRSDPQFPAILAAGAALLVYAITLGGTYVYDDVVLLKEDPRLTHVNRWSEYWTQPHMPGAVDKLYRPLTCMTFAIEHAIHGDRPWIFHLVNWLLHAGAAAAVAELARRLFGMRVAIAAGVLFAVHPVHVEAVAGLVGRAELLCTLFSLIALILFLRRMTTGRAIAIVAFTVLAILSKEQGILLPILLAALAPFRWSESEGNRKGAKARRDREVLCEEPAPFHGFSFLCDFFAPWRLCGFSRKPIPPTSDNHTLERGAMGLLVALLCLATAGYVTFREQYFGFGWDRDALDWEANPLIRSVGIDRLLMPLVLLGRYLLLLVAPAKLSLDYGTHVIGWTVDWRQPYVYLGAAGLLAWLVAFICSLRQRHWATIFCLLALAITYGMVSNSLVLIGTIFGERLMYLPSAFFLILITALLARVASPGWFAVVIVFLALLGSIRTFTRAQLWNDPLALYLADLHDHPQSMHLHGLCVDQYLARGDYRAARAMAEDSLRELPECTESYRMAVAADVMLGDFADGEKVLAHPDKRCPGLKILRVRQQLEQAERH